MLRCTPPLGSHSCAHPGGSKSPIRKSSSYYAKQKNVPEDFKGTPGYGDVWTWTAIDADTKLVPSWLVG